MRRTRSRSTGFLAPALNGLGHCSTHSPQELFDLIKFGATIEKSPMPAWGAKLADPDIQAIIRYIKTLWPRRLRRRYEAPYGG